MGKDGYVNAFREKSDLDGDLINIGFMMFQPEIFDYIDGDSTVFEQAPLNRLVADRQLRYYTHKGFWQCMDTLRESRSWNSSGITERRRGNYGSDIVCLALNFIKDKAVFVTGHTGFKGSWLCKLLVNAGQKVTGYSLSPPTNPSLFEIAGLANDFHSVIGDIRDASSYAGLLRKRSRSRSPSGGAARCQDSYKDPAYTYETNVMGTVNYPGMRPGRRLGKVLLEM